MLQRHIKIAAKFGKLPKFSSVSCPVFGHFPLSGRRDKIMPSFLSFLIYD